MKIIALVPFKNEERFLPTFLSGIRNCVDEIVAIDDQSTDRSTEIMEAAGASVYRLELERSTAPGAHEGQSPVARA